MYHKLIDDWPADGRYILHEEQDPQDGWDLWILPLNGDRKPFKFLATPFDERSETFSPDGHWIAYQSNETGANQISSNRSRL